MRREIAWSDNAITLLDEIYNFYCKKSKSAAIRLYNRLLDSTEPLKTFIEIHAIWDCRQDDWKLKEMFR
ncbi:hypothetical protein [uncultured Parabacteroides sp.]|uniref:hypothetical protein n=1 Tax=uncultured Parabacteroides sp. TaxID=512312 RepID=UPI00259AF75A|nr:hypothetical protein [uncultured Parabacteroides sp.]